MPVPSPELFDTHCHLTDDRFAGEVEQVVERALQANVVGLVTIASDVRDSRAALEVAREHGIYCTAGIHPHAASTWSPEAMTEVGDLLGEPEVVAVGETGLDFHYDNSPRDVQLRSFEAHLDLAENTGLPVVVHSRSADAEMIEVLRRRGADVTGVLHCFTGTDALFEAGLHAGWYFSFGGMVTFKSFAGQDHLTRIPWNRLMLETDSPYLAPVPMRGRRNEPSLLPHTCVAVAGLRGVDVEEAARRTFESAREFYGLA
jgi:TatD DNase family protein